MAKKKTDASLHDHQAALAQTCADLPHAVVIFGEESYLRQQAIRRIQSALEGKHPGLQTDIYHGAAAANESGAKLSEILLELSSTSLFAREKLVIMRRADRILFPANPTEEDSAAKSSPRPNRKNPQQALADFLDVSHDATWLVIECEKLNRQRKLGKTLAARARLVPCPAINKLTEVATWVNTAAKEMGKQVERDAVELLYSSHGGNLGHLHSELTKLVTYVGDRTKIRLQDVEAFFSGSLEFDVFSLTNAVEARDLKTALLFARRIIDQGTRNTAGNRNDGQSSAHMALAMLSKSMQNILRTRVLSVKNKSLDSLAAGLGMPTWRARHLATAAKKYPVRDLRRAIRFLAEAIHGSHDTGGDVALSLERSVVMICGT